MGRGRKPLGEKKLSNAEKQKRYQERNKNIIKDKDQKRKKISRVKFKKDFPLLHEVRLRMNLQKENKGDRKGKNNQWNQWL